MECIYVGNHQQSQRRRNPRLYRPDGDGLHAAFLFAIIACLIAAAASLMRGGHPAHDEDPTLLGAPTPRRPLIADPERQHAH